MAVFKDMRESIPSRKAPRRPAHGFGLKEIPPDFDDPLPPEIEAEFYDGTVYPQD